MKRLLRATMIVGLVCAGIAMWRRRTMADEIVGSMGSTGRNATVAKVGARTGGRWAVTKARKTFASAERKEALSAEFEMKTTEDVVSSLGNLKGAMMKVGQMASYLDLGLPENARATLAQLQTEAPPMSGDLAASVIIDEFGRHPDDLFAEWDPSPIASASIGQVHRAITHDGQAVAVKVQYPGVAQAIESDLRTNDAIFSALRLMFPGIDTTAITEELRERLSEELDYELEARNQKYFAAHFDRHPFINVPKVIDELSSRTVLTSELVVGSTFAELLEWSEEERNLAAETLFRFTFGSIYRLAAFNGDPHPGNYIFHGEGRITFLDFGLVKHFSEDDTSLFESLISNMVVSRDDAAFRRTIEDAGLLKPGQPFSDASIGEYFSYFYDFVSADKEFTFDEEYSAAGVRAIFETGGEHGELKKVLDVPSSFVVLQRINLGVVALFGQLKATQNWRRIAEELWPFVEAGPSTPMGGTIERWGRASGRRSEYQGL
jgi:predicted unusual protein kinase regulating ubiquinone biosynthesis (AarF/ABC1/UbiB family)